jgi:hypothetical protein
MLPPSPVPKRETFKVPQTFAQALALHTEAIQAGDFGANGRKPGQSLSRSCAGDGAGRLHRTVHARLGRFCQISFSHCRFPI